MDQKCMIAGDFNININDPDQLSKVRKILSNKWKILHINKSTWRRSFDSQQCSNLDFIIFKGNLNIRLESYKSPSHLSDHNINRITIKTQKNDNNLRKLNRVYTSIQQNKTRKWV